MAIAPCGDFAECKVLIEINATDGDIGFHFLVDGDDLVAVKLFDPNKKKLLDEKVKKSLRKQRLTETFGESAEPLCWADPNADPDETIVTLEQFVGRWAAGTYLFKGRNADLEQVAGQTVLTHALPAAPAALAFDVNTGVISWAAGDSLGQCGSAATLDALVASGVLPVHPKDVQVAAWEVVLTPDIGNGNPIGKLTFSIRVPGSIAAKAVTVPTQYLAALPPDTPVKIEIGAIGTGDNATFAEVAGFCVNETLGCD
jgi:hypothetical protein